jgi:hypothetical protein
MNYLLNKWEAIKGGVSEWVAGFKSSITPLVLKQFFQIFYIK